MSVRKTLKLDNPSQKRARATPAPISDKVHYQGLGGAICGIKGVEVSKRLDEVTCGRCRRWIEWRVNR